jgi:hypothetical protein
MPVRLVLMCSCVVLAVSGCIGGKAGENAARGEAARQETAALRAALKDEILKSYRNLSPKGKQDAGTLVCQRVGSWISTKERDEINEMFDVSAQQDDLQHILSSMTSGICSPN